MMELDMMSWAIPKLEAWLATRVEGWVWAGPDQGSEDTPPSDYDEQRIWRGYPTQDDRNKRHKKRVPQYSQDEAAWARLWVILLARGLRDAFEKAKKEIVDLEEDLLQPQLRVKAAVYCWPKAQGLD